MTRRRRKADGTVITGRRPRILDPAVRTAMLNAFDAGATIEAACAVAGVHPAAFYNWVNRADDEIERLVALQAEHPDSDPQPRPEEAPFVEFVESVSRVRAQRQVRMLGVIDKVAHGGYVKSVREDHNEGGGYAVTKTWAEPDWRAAAWWLERAFPDRFSRKVEGSTHNTLGVVVSSGAPGGSAGMPGIDAQMIADLSDRLKLSFARQEADAPVLTVGPASRTGVDDEGAVDAEIVDEETATS